MGLDSTDLKILSVLLRNSRTPYSQIARMLNLGESTVYMRVKKLMETGVLRSFTVDIDLGKVGLVVHAFIDLKAEPRRTGDLISQLKRLPWVVEIYEVSGEYPIAIKVVARDNADLSAKIDSIGKLNGVRELNVRYVLRTISKRVEPELLSRILTKSSIS